MCFKKYLKLILNTAQMKNIYHAVVEANSKT